MKRLRGSTGEPEINPLIISIVYKMCLVESYIVSQRNYAL